MKRNVILSCVLAMALLAAVPAMAAPPFGSFGGNRGRRQLRRRRPAAARLGSRRQRHPGRGHPGGRRRGRPRQLRPGAAGGDHAVPRLPRLGPSRLGLRARHQPLPQRPAHGDRAGPQQGRRGREPEPRAGSSSSTPTHNLRPFGKIEFPHAQAEMRGNCDIDSPNRRYSVISGYALDVGVHGGGHRRRLRRAADRPRRGLAVRPRLRPHPGDGRADQLLRHPPRRCRTDLPRPQGQHRTAASASCSTSAT